MKSGKLKDRHETGALLVLVAGMVMAGAAGATPVAIQGAVRTGNDVTLTVASRVAATCRVEATANAATGPWAAVGSGFSVSAGTNAVVLAGEAAAVRRFYRVAWSVVAPAGVRHVPAGTFLMGDQSTGSPRDGATNELPVVSVRVDDFFLKTTEVTLTEWNEVETWALANGYTFSTNAGLGKAGDHPVHSVSWYDVLKWCNAKSELENREPCYFAGTVVFRTGSGAVTWNTSRNGYRLPSEAEWERAARGGLGGERFPWGATAGHARANYRAEGSLTYETSAPLGFHPAWETVGIAPYTAPVGSFAANALGLHDMSGNVREFCWDRLTSAHVSPYVVDVTAPNDLFERVVRGGDWSTNAYTLRCAYRGGRFPGNTGKGNFVGFRFARNL